jgi:hypothetical protein
MQNISKPLLATLAFALISFTAYQTARFLSPSTQVLGDSVITIPTPSPKVYNNNSGIPCSVISNLQRMYCSSDIGTTNPIKPTLTPTRKITPTRAPTPTITKTACNCDSANGYNYCRGTAFRYNCLNGTSITCIGTKVCGPTPTSYLVKPTSANPTYTIPKVTVNPIYNSQ